MTKEQTVANLEIALQEAGLKTKTFFKELICIKESPLQVVVFGEKKFSIQEVYSVRRRVREIATATTIKEAVNAVKAPKKAKVSFSK